MAGLRQQYQAERGTLVALLHRELRKLWPSLWKVTPTARKRASLPQEAVDPVVALVTQYAEASSALAGDYYEAERDAAGVPGSFTVSPPRPPEPEQVEKSLSWALSEWDQATGEILKRREQEALDRAEGGTQRMVANTGRETVVRAVTDDREAIAWARLPTGETTCYFCALMCSRGAVYKDRNEAGGRNARSRRNPRNPGKPFLGEGEFKFHDHCDCIAVPVFSHGWEPPQQVQDWDALYIDSTSGVYGDDKLKAFRKAFEGRA